MASENSRKTTVKNDRKHIVSSNAMLLIRTLHKTRTSNMKKFLLIVSAAALTFAVACKKEKKTGGGTTAPAYEVEPYQNAAIFYFGGTWCGPCGYYGKPAKETLHNNNPKLTILSAQLNSGTTKDPMNNATSNSFASFFGISSIPAMFVGGASQPMPSWIGSGIVAGTVQTKIDEFRAKPAVVNAKMTFSTIIDAVTANIKFQFYSATSDEYYYNVVATESGLTATQASDNSTKKNIHDNVIRAMSGGTVYGDLLTSGATEKQVISKSATITLDPSWKKANVEYHVIIWAKNTTTNKYSLANSVTAKIQ